MPQRKRLTPKQKRLVKAVVMDPHQTLEQLGQASDYHGAANVNRALKAPAVVDALAQCQQLMDQREKLTLGALMTHLEEGLEATEVKALKVVGTAFKVESEVKDFGVRHKFLSTALELRQEFSAQASAASLRTNPPIRPIRPVSSARGTNITGGNRPRSGCSHRTSASRPTTRPVSSETMGW